MFLKIFGASALRYQRPWTCKYYSIEAITKKAEGCLQPSVEWKTAKSFRQIPGPSSYVVPFMFLPGGKFYNLQMIEFLRKIYSTYGPIVRFKIFGKREVIYTFNVDDIRKIFRADGQYPYRRQLDTVNYYREIMRKDIFKGNIGIIASQGKIWAQNRSALNPIFMKPQNVKSHIPQIDQVVGTFLKRIAEIRDPQSLEMPGDFRDEITNGIFECTGVIVFNQRLGVIGRPDLDSLGYKIVSAANIFFSTAYKLEMRPSFWRIYSTKNWKKLVQAFDTMYDVAERFIEEAHEKMNKSPATGHEYQPIIEQLIQSDRHLATLTTMDMLMAGIDSTAALFVNCLYDLATSPEKQEKLRNEIFSILPDKAIELNGHNMLNAPYLRACIKETLRKSGIAPTLFRKTGQDLVLSGYQVPKGTDVTLGAGVVATEEEHFPMAKEFIPERWLRSDEYHKQYPSVSETDPFINLPFGFGPRTCLGKRVAEMEIEVVLCRVLQNYRVSWERPALSYGGNFLNSPQGELRFKFSELNQ